MGHVYRLKCLVNYRIYIGSTSDIDSRKSNHFNSLKHNRHRNRYLQDDYNKYGPDSFEFTILEEVADDKLLEREQWYIDNTDCLVSIGGYNILPKAGSPEGASLHSKEYREKLSKQRVGEGNPFFGKTHSDDYKKEISKRQTGEGNVKAKLTWSCVHDIRRMILQG